MWLSMAAHAAADAADEYGKPSNLCVPRLRKRVHDKHGDEGGEGRPLDLEAAARAAVAAKGGARPALCPSCSSRYRHLPPSPTFAHLR